MKVLMTGFTALQVNSLRRPISKIDGPAAVVESLRESGHEVDWRRVTVGEDLSSYDVIWVNLAPLNSLNGRIGAMGSLYALSSGKPCVGFFDDWQFNTVFNGARALTRRPEILYKYMIVGTQYRDGEDASHFSRESAEAAYERMCAKMPEARKGAYIERYFMNDRDDDVKPNEERLVASAGALLAERWNRGMVPVCPMYRWGNRTGVRKRMPDAVQGIEALDLSPIIYPMLARHDDVPMVDKKKEWLLAALIPHDDWLNKQNLEWPVHIVGAKKLIKSHGGERLKTEDEVIDRYAERVAALSPKYMHAGSGWWRSRFLYCAKVGSILVCDEAEGAPLGPAYQIKPYQVEKASDEQLVEMVQAQRAALRPWLTQPADFTAHVNHLVERAYREDKGWEYTG